MNLEAGAGGGDDTPTFSLWQQAQCRSDPQMESRSMPLRQTLLVWIYKYSFYVLIMLVSFSIIFPIFLSFWCVLCWTKSDVLWLLFSFVYSFVFILRFLIYKGGFFVMCITHSTFTTDGLSLCIVAPGIIKDPAVSLKAFCPHSVFWIISQSLLSYCFVCRLSFLISRFYSSWTTLMWVYLLDTAQLCASTWKSLFISEFPLACTEMRDRLDLISILMLFLLCILFSNIFLSLCGVRSSLI